MGSPRKQNYELVVHQAPSLIPRMSIDTYVQNKYVKKNDKTTSAFFEKQKNRLSQAEDKITKYKS